MGYIKYKKITGIDDQFRIILLRYINDNVLKLDDKEFSALINDIPNFQQELNDNIKKLMEKVKPDFDFSSSFERLDSMKYTPFQEDKRKKYQLKFQIIFPVYWIYLTYQS